MMKRMGKCFAVLATIVIAAGSVTAENDGNWYNKIDVNGFVSAGYHYNFNKPSTGLNSLRVFDLQDNSFNLDVAQLAVQHEAEGEGDAGFRVDVIGGGELPQVTASAGLNTSTDFDILQAYGTYIAPVGSGLTVTAGKFVTHIGAEVIEGVDGINDNYTRSFQFGYAIPFTHTGVKASYDFGERFSATAMIVNGWDNVEDNNKSKSIGAQFALTPVGELSLIFNYMGGPERAANNDDIRHIFDVVAVWQPIDPLAITLNFDHGKDENGAGAGVDATWTAIGGTVRYDVSDKFSVALRGEQFDDKNGFRTGTTQKLKEITFTPTYRLTDNFLVRGDLRFDKSDKRTFTKENTVSDDQSTVSLNTVYQF